jgi:hypothetical protein
MYTVWHVDKYKITFKLVIDHGPRARYRAAARRLRNTGLKDKRRQRKITRYSSKVVEGK